MLFLLKLDKIYKTTLENCTKFYIELQPNLRSSSMEQWNSSQPHKFLAYLPHLTSLGHITCFFWQLVLKRSRVLVPAPVYTRLRQAWITHNLHHIFVNQSTEMTKNEHFLNFKQSLTTTTSKVFQNAQPSLDILIKILRMLVWTHPAHLIQRCYNNLFGQTHKTYNKLYR